MNFFRNLILLQPLTFRGFLTVALSLWALLSVAIPESDLVANIIARGLLCLTSLILATTIILSFYLKKKIKAQAHFDNLNPLSKTPIAAGIIIHEANLPPFYSLYFERIFDHPGVSSPKHHLKNKSEKRNLLDTATFDHRGYWTLTALKFTLTDALGLTGISWQTSMNSSIEVSAPDLPLEQTPITPTSSQAGDQQSHWQKRTGDLYDLKPYDPSEPMNRILWKTYAKTGELIVRRPEPAIVPEGEIAIYLIAAKEDDHVAGALQTYLKEVQEKQIKVLFGTDGLRNFETNLSEIKHAINHSVWSQDSGTGKGLANFINYLSEANKHPNEIIIFCSEQSQSFRKTRENINTIEVLVQKP